MEGALEVVILDEEIEFLVYIRICGGGGGSEDDESVCAGHGIAVIAALDDTHGLTSSRQCSVISRRRQIEGVLYVWWRGYVFEDIVLSGEPKLNRVGESVRGGFWRIVKR